MGFALVISLLALLYVLSIAGTWLAVWLACRVWRVPKASLARTGAVAPVIVVLSTLSALLEIWGAGHLERLSPTLSLVLLLPAILMIVLPFVAIRIAFRTRLGRTIGTGLTALVLGSLLNLGVALAFKATLLEAFTVPTNSMAPAIIGRHVRVRCGICATTVRLPPPFDDRGYPLGRDPSFECPRCTNTLARPEKVRPGDRLLVERILPPRRWDVMVFRSPEYPEVNHVDRVAGLPGEAVEIIGGDVFVNGQRAARPPNEHTDMWVPLSDTAGGRAPAAWRPDQGARWDRSGPAWTATPKPDEPATLRFARPIDDALAINPSFPPFRIEPRPVSDVLVRIAIGNQSPESRLTLRWARAGDVVVFSFERPLLTIRHAEERQVTKTSTSSPNIAFGVRDGVAFILAGDEILATLPVRPQTADEARSDSDRIDAPVTLELIASGGSITLERLRVSRDVHYRQMQRPRLRPRGVAGNPITLGPDEYFVLGDNSTAAKDGRLWEVVDPRYAGHQPGAVPTDAIIGVVRATYAPLDRLRRFP